MSVLTERLEVRVPPQTLQLLRQEAQRRGVSVAQIAREAIDLMLKEDRQARLLAAEALFQVEAPVADWGAMKREIEETHLEGGFQ